MITITGKYNAAKVYADDLESGARGQINKLLDQAFTEGSSIRIMPDVHAGAGCAIGTTMSVRDKVVPNLVGVDIGCGMETIKLATGRIEFPKLDSFIHQNIPAGAAVRQNPHRYLDRAGIDKLRCRKHVNLDRGELSLGTLGGGNHFIEIDRDDEGNLYLIVHSGNEDGYLTRAGSLLTDQHIVYNSRLFCTKWNGLSKGSIFDDALDDKEYEGNLIYLLSSGSDFIKNNTKVRFVKEATERIDKPDYAERAVTEILINALIHRDYLIMGSEVHIDIYDDRVEVSSPGGMYSGKMIQELDIDRLKSERRNPNIADLFHRMKYMERRGSGLKKIINETKKLPGYSERFRPEFYSTTSSFTVVLKNVNYTGDQETDFGINFGINFGLNETQQRIIDLLIENPLVTTQAVADSLGLTRRTVENYISQLKKAGLVEREGARKNGRWIVKAENGYD